MAFWRQHQEKIEYEQWAEWADGGHNFEAGEIKMDKYMSEAERLLVRLLSHCYVSKINGGLVFGLPDGMTIAAADGEPFENELIPYLDKDKARELRNIRGIGEINGK